MGKQKEKFVSDDEKAQEKDLQLKLSHAGLEAVIVFYGV